MIKKILILIFKFTQKTLIKIFKKIGYELNLNIRQIPKMNGINLNIGAGSYTIPGFKSLDFYSDHYYKNKSAFSTRLNYNIRENKIPYLDNSVDNIYISHVIEHIEDKYIENFLQEAYRVLKPKAVLRVVCPDGKFLFEVSQFKNEYWSWRRKTFNNNMYNTDWNDINRYDFLIRETSTPRCRFYKNKI